MAMNLSLLYRGSLSSCNYACAYCPFAKHAETSEELSHDRDALERFVSWVEKQDQYNISILFTPWGEALIRKWYQKALIRLSRVPILQKVAIQTNLSCPLHWVEECAKDRLALWATYHPTQVQRSRFLSQCMELDRRGIRFSVGIVGLKENQEEIAFLRRELPSHIYLWINAYKRESNYYTDAEIAWLGHIDPLFSMNNRHHASAGKACKAGHTVISIDGEGTIRRCHFIREPLGNIYEDKLESILQPTPCTNQTCGCHIGYVHLEELKLYDQFGSGILERIPESYRQQGLFSLPLSAGVETK